MLNKEKQLLCTFSNKDKYQELISKICSFYTVLDGKIFVFANIKNINEYYLTYNVAFQSVSGKFPNTISIHRKKLSNTLYTLNAMNKLITEENNGVFDKSFQLNWDLYKNSLILTNDIGVKIVGLQLTDIISI